MTGIASGGLKLQCIAKATFYSWSMAYCMIKS